VSVDETPVPRAAALALAAQGRRFLIKVGGDTLRLDGGIDRIPGAIAEKYLVHEDGFLRVPLLVVGDLLVRGFTEAIYREALEGVAREGGER
jgi:hypothetical protein